MTPKIIPNTSHLPSGQGILLYISKDSQNQQKRMATLVKKVFQFSAKCAAFASIAHRVFKIYTRHIHKEEFSLSFSGLHGMEGQRIPETWFEQESSHTCFSDYFQCLHSCLRDVFGDNSEGMSFFYRSIVAEHASKQMVYELHERIISKQLKEKDVIELPLFYNGDKKCLHLFEINKIFSIGGIPAYGLLSPSYPPIICFIGTALPCLRSLFRDERSLPTWQADIDPKGVGWQAFNSSKEEIERWLEDKCQAEGKKAFLLGHSLGGALATYTACHLAQWIDTCFVFNAPLTNEETYKKVKSLKKSPKLYRFHVQDDVVSKLGGRYLVGNNFDIQPRSPIKDVHSQSVLSTFEYNLYKINTEKENNSIKSRVCSLFYHRFTRVFENHKHLAIHRLHQIQQRALNNPILQSISPYL